MVFLNIGNNLKSQDSCGFQGVFSDIFVDPTNTLAISFVALKVIPMYYQIFDANRSIDTGSSN